MNTCFDPDVFNIQTLPQQVKNIVTDRYKDLKDFQGTINFMNSIDRDTQEIREQRKERIMKADKYRNENFGEVFPLLDKMLGVYHGT